MYVEGSPASAPEANPTPVPAPEREITPIDRRTATWPVPGYAGWSAGWARSVGGALHVEVHARGLSWVRTIVELNEAADRNPSGFEARVLRAVEGGR